MRFFKPQPDAHQFYCGIDLHARTHYLCVLDHAGKKVLHKEVPSEPTALLDALAPYRQGLVVNHQPHGSASAGNSAFSTNSINPRRS